MRKRWLAERQPHPCTLYVVGAVVHVCEAMLTVCTFLEMGFFPHGCCAVFDTAVSTLF